MCASRRKRYCRMRAWLLPPMRIATRVPGFRLEGSLKRNSMVRLKIVVFAPIPSANEKIPAAANPGFRPSARGA